jgi:hypothetical protein
MPRKSSGIPTQEEPKPLTLAAHLPDTSAELQPHVAAMLSALAADTAHFAPIASDVTKGQTDNGTLGTAIQQAKTGGEAEKQAVHAADKVVRQDVREIVPKVQGILRNVSPDLVPGILANILLYQSHIGERPPKAPFEAKDPPKGSPPGMVLLVALAIPGALTYDYEVSTDQITWTLGVKSGKSRVTLSGLIPAKQYWFRVSAFLRDGTTTQPIVSQPHIVR